MAFQHSAIAPRTRPTGPQRLLLRISTLVLCFVGYWTPQIDLAASAQQVVSPPQEQQQLRPGQFVQRGQQATASSAVDFQTDEPFSATYVGAETATVVNQVLGEFLKIDYSIAPDVSGLVTMRVDNIQSRPTFTSW